MSLTTLESRIRVAPSRAAIAALWEECGPFPDDLIPLANARLVEVEGKCSMCDRPAFVTKSGRVQRYCTTQGCGTTIRHCRHPGCGREFAPHKDGAGRTRCIEHVTAHAPSLITHACARCGKLGRGSDRLWPYVCEECRYPLRHVIKQLRDHHVPWSMAVRLFDDPTCDICRRDILTLEVRRGSGRLRTALVVDHDHSCKNAGCGAYSCGQCVRGFLCGHCNTGLGLFIDTPGALRAAADYLDRWHTR
jgi:hypothetical protein